MKTQKELGRKVHKLTQIINDSESSLNDDLITLKQDPEQFINNIYEVSYDEMNEKEAEESISWIKETLIKEKGADIFNNEIILPTGETLSKWQIQNICQEHGDNYESMKKDLLSNPDDGWTEKGIKLFIDFLESDKADEFLSK